MAEPEPSHGREGTPGVEPLRPEVPEQRPAAASEGLHPRQETDESFTALLREVDSFKRLLALIFGWTIRSTRGIADPLAQAQEARKVLKIFVMTAVVFGLMMSAVLAFVAGHAGTGATLGFVASSGGLVGVGKAVKHRARSKKKTSRDR